MRFQALSGLVFAVAAGLTLLPPTGAAAMLGPAAGAPATAAATSTQPVTQPVTQPLTKSAAQPVAKSAAVAPAKPLAARPAGMQSSPLPQPAPAALAALSQPIPDVLPKPRPIAAVYSLAPATSLVPAGRPAIGRPAAASRPATARPAVIAAALPVSDLPEANRPTAIRKGHGHWLWCVPFAQTVSHIDIHADAYRWWSMAANRYARGAQPVPGAVLTFRSVHQMPLGHVAVVAKVMNPREVLVDQANWVPNTVTVGTAVIDVSARNDWSEVRVQNLDGSFGGVYPTYGFIYNKAPQGQG